MKINDFDQLSSKQRREFLINSCQHIISVNIADELIKDLFYCRTGKFFIEVYYSVLWEKFLEMTAFSDSDRLLKYLNVVDFSDLFESLKSDQ